MTGAAAVGEGLSGGDREAGGAGRQTLDGSFSAVSKPIFATKASFCSINFFEIYKKIIFSRANFANFCKIFSKFFKILKILPKFCQNFAKSCKICSRENDFLVDLEKINAAK